MKSDYEERKARRIAQFSYLSEKYAKESEQRFKVADKMASCIPFGQPILIGHHSEQRDRNFRKKIENNFSKGVELSQKADYYQHRAASAASNRAISSDDPEAISKLKERIAAAEKNHRIMKDANKAFKKAGLEGLKQFDETIQKAAMDYLKFSACYGMPFPPFSLTNSNAEIRRLKKRLEQLEKAATDQTQELIVNDIRIIDNVEDNRVQIFFPGIPSEAVRKYMKSHGFHWTRSIGCWQRFRSYDALCVAKKVLSFNE